MKLLTVTSGDSEAVGSAVSSIWGVELTSLDGVEAASDTNVTRPADDAQH